MFQIELGEQSSFQKYTIKYTYSVYHHHHHQLIACGKKFSDLNWIAVKKIRLSFQKALNSVQIIQLCQVNQSVRLMSIFDPALFNLPLFTKYLKKTYTHVQQKSNINDHAFGFSDDMWHYLCRKTLIAFLVNSGKIYFCVYEKKKIVIAHHGLEIFFP